MPRFVLLFHNCPPDYERGSHWDLMFEAEGVLRTWALAELPPAWQAAHQLTTGTCGNCPALATANEVAATELPDHRTAYLDYEGPVSGGRGMVTRIAAGTFDTLSQSPDRWEVRVAGRDLAGQIKLSRAPAGGADWHLTYQSAAPST